jgi:cystathionine beta-lyase family protein involved in aluminum resistance
MITDQTLPETCLESPLEARAKDMPFLEATTLLELAEHELQASLWKSLDAIYFKTAERVMTAFKTHKVSEEHFWSVSGYGHHDVGRSITDAVFADALQAESALVRTQIVSGTHAISIALNACLAVKTASQALQKTRTLLSVTGRPYDTLEEVIGIRGDSQKSLLAQGIRYLETSVFEFALPAENTWQCPVLKDQFTKQDKSYIELADVILIQRSRGYSLRPSLTVEQIARIINQIKAVNPNAIVLVDNCYGEFTQNNEPTSVGADLIAGSLIKNPGGGIAPTGGYIAGCSRLVLACADELTCPGVGAEGGYTFNLTRTLLQGLYLAPGMVNNSLKGMTLAAKLFEQAGYATMPCWRDERSDIIQVLRLETPEKLIRFCQVLQQNSPVSSHITPVPDLAPGYGDPIVMAGGTFIDGSTIELSADGPLREPFAVYLQGGLDFAHTRMALVAILKELQLIAQSA